MYTLLWICLTFGQSSPECQAGYAGPDATIYAAGAQVDESESRYERRRARSEKRAARSAVATTATVIDGDAITRQTVRQPVASILWRLVYGAHPNGAQFVR